MRCDLRNLLATMFCLLCLSVWTAGSHAATSYGTTQDAVEYYHSGFGHYFITAFPDEVAAIDGGAVQGWSRTGKTFKVYQYNATGLNTVCRFFSTSFSPKSSHFYTPFTNECNAVKLNADWQFEANAFYVQTPDSTTGVCPSGTSKVYRLYNNGLSGAPNHRYTTDTSVRSQMISQGWISEGYGSLGVIFCAPDTSDGGTALTCGFGNGGGTNGVSLYTPNNLFTYKLSTTTANALDIATVTWGAANSGSVYSYTGSLSATLWAVSSSYSGVSIYGFVLGIFSPNFTGSGAYSSSQILAGKYSLNTIISSDAEYNPPAGQYCMVLTLMQYMPGQCSPNPDGYCIVDWLQFSNPVVFY